MATPPKRTDIKLDEFRKLLEAERGRLKKMHQIQVSEIREESEDAAGNELSHVASFDSGENEDTAANMADRDRETALDENAVAILRRIDHALDRIAEGTYGICEITGKPIPVARLRAIPWATMTVEAAAQYDT